MPIVEKEKKLIKNTGILAIGTLCSKIFSFILLPLYTSVLTTEDYGTVDVLQTVASFAIPFVSLQVSSAIFRFIIEKKSDKAKAKVISSGIMLVVFNSIIFTGIVVVINYFFTIKYCSLFIIYFSALVILEVTQNITRGLGNNKLYSFTSFLMTIISLSSNLILILGFGYRGNSILIASIIAYYTAGCVSFFRQSLWKYIRISYFSIQELKSMLSYCLPLIPNAISWWIANTSDRIIIRIVLGAGCNGVYAAANKIPTIYTTVFNVYNLAWIEALSRNSGHEDQYILINKLFDKSFKLFGCIILILICSVSLFFNFIIGSNYDQAYEHIYILLVAIFLNSICSLLGGVFTAYKKTKVIGKTTIVGAIANIIINIILVKFIGLYAASISTLISYFIILIIRVKSVNDLIQLHWPLGFIRQLLCMLIVISTGYFIRNSFLNIVLFIILVVWSGIVNKELLINVGSTLKSRKLLK